MALIILEHIYLFCQYMVLVCSAIAIWIFYGYNNLLVKKKVTLFSLFSTIIILGSYISFAFWFLGFVIAKLLGAKADGKEGIVKSIIIPLGKYELHLHHWFVSLGIGVFGIIREVYVLSPEIFYGFLGGLVFQGIYCYNDWYKIVKPRQR